MVFAATSDAEKVADNIWKVNKLQNYMYVHGIFS
jgi:hypothetical protein